MVEGKAGFHSREHIGQSGYKNWKMSPRGPLAQPPKCPECTSQHVWKDGLRYTKNGNVQRYICRECGHRFSENTWNNSDDPEHVQRVHTDKSYSTYALTLDRQVCVAETQEAKNLVKVETRQKQAAGATKPSEADLKGKIIEFAWRLKKEGYAESTMRTYVGAIETLVRKGANIFDAESVKDTIAKQTWNKKTKFNYVNFYDAFARMMGIAWEKPRYKPAEKLPFIPLEKHIDQLIYSAGRKMGTLLQLIKETAMRIGEALQLRWENIDSENNRIILNNPEKGGRPRVFKVSSELMARIMRLPRKSHKIFGTASKHSYQTQFLLLRKRLARQLNNPMLLKVTFHTLRHWKATMLYHRTKDILYVMRFLGHKNIKNTLIYTQLIEFEREDQYHVKVAKTLKGACGLVKVGFEYVTDIEDAKIFRKRR